MTPRETELVLHGHYVRDLQMSVLVAATINAHRDPKRSRKVVAEDISVFARREGARTEQTPEQHARILKTLAAMFGRKRKE